jgi:hypothetical protein
MPQIMKNILILFSALLAGFLFNSCDKSSADTAAAPGTNGAGGSTAKFTIAGNYLYVVDHESVKSFDISNPAGPVYKDRTTIGLNIETIFPYGDKLFIGSSSSMYIYSLNNPAKPERLSKADYSIRMACDPVVAKDSTAYATLRSQNTGPCGGAGISALLVFNIKNPNLPIEIKRIFLNSPQGLGVKDSALYVCEREGGLKIFNVKNTFSPVEVAQKTGETYYDVIPYNNILICQVQGGLVLYDIGNNPLQPVFLSKISNK